MATLLHADRSTTNGRVFPTPSPVSFTAGRRVALWVASGAQTGNVTECTVTTPSGIVFEKIEDWGLGGENPTPRKGQLYEAVPHVTVSEVVTMTFAGTSPANDQDECHWFFVQLEPGQEILQIQGSTQANFQTGITSITMGRFNNPDNDTILFVLKGDPGAVTKEAGWEDPLAQTAGSIYGAHALWKNGEDLSPSCTWGASVHAPGIALEVGTRTPGTCDVYPSPRGKGSGASGTSVATHASFRMRKNHRYLFWVYNGVGSGTPAEVTPDPVAGVTFTKKGTIVNPSLRRLTLWEGVVGATDVVSSVVFRSDGGATQSLWGFAIDHSGGSQSIAETKTGTSTSATSIPVTLDDVVVGRRVVQCAAIFNNSATPSLESGYDEVDNHPVSSPSTYRLFVQTEADVPDTSPTVGYSPATHAASIAIELVPVPPVVASSRSGFWQSTTRGRRRSRIGRS